MTDPLPTRLIVGHLARVADSRPIGTVLSASLVIALVGCDLFALPATGRTPSVVGVIADEENAAGRVTRFHLESGEIVEIDFNESVTLLDDALGGGPGALLFYGNGEDPWYFTLREPREGGGPYTFAAPATDDDAHIVFDNGLRLPKASDFDGRGWPQGGRYDSPVAECCFAPFCINPRGEVTAYLAGPADQREGCPAAV